MKTVYLIDFSNFAYKFKSVYTFAKTEVNGVKVDVSVLAGFIRCLKTNLANDIVIVLDGVPSRSLSVLPGYKGQRLHDDMNNFISVPKIEVIQFLTKIGELINKNVSVVCSPGQETDEVISSIVHKIVGKLPPRAEFISRLNTRDISTDKFLRYLNKGLVLEDMSDNYEGAIIGSTDGDFIQLQRFPHVAIDLSSSGKKVSKSTTSKSTSDVTPIASIPYKAIYGDISDNIPTNKLPWKKEIVLDILNRGITTDEELLKFKQDCLNGTPEKTHLANIANYIYNNCKKQFEINWTVAFLEFRSFPKKLYYPDYDIQDTINKFGLKV